MSTQLPQRPHENESFNHDDRLDFQGKVPISFGSHLTWFWLTWMPRRRSRSLGTSTSPTSWFECLSRFISPYTTRLSFVRLSGVNINSDKPSRERILFTSWATYWLTSKFHPIGWIFESRWSLHWIQFGMGLRCQENAWQSCAGPVNHVVPRKANVVWASKKIGARSKLLLALRPVPFMTDV